MAQIKGTNVGSPVVPFDTADVHPSHEARYGKGGYRTVATTAERNAIPAARREAGMLVYVVAGETIYSLGSDLTTWAPLELGSTLPAGTEGYVLTYTGGSWVAATGDQTITLTGDVTGSGTGSFAATLANTAVTAGSYGSASSVGVFTVDGKGRLTAAGSTAIAVAAGAVTSGTFSTARLGSGTASSSTWLRGDGTWSDVRRAIRSDVSSSTNYVGVAASGSATSASVWTIYRTIYTSAGAISSRATATNVKWDDRTTASYI